MLPFSSAEFFNVFENYNTDIPYAGPVLSLLALIAIGSLIIGDRTSRPIGALILAVFWLWSGLIYHIGYFSRINPAAYLFGTLFILQAAVLVRVATTGEGVSLAGKPDRRFIAGVLLLGYALIIYPAAGYLLGNGFPRGASFGLPCPVTIYTIGVLLMTVRPIRLQLAVIPLIWSVIGSTATVLFGVWEDLGLLVAGSLLLVFLIFDRSAGRRFVNPG